MSGSEGTPDADRNPPHVVELCRPTGPPETIDVEAGETIVDAAESAGIDIPYGCLYGGCGTCTAELLDGTVSHRKPPRALKPKALRAGYVLPCVAVPETDCRLRVGHAIQAEVLGTPWK